jgi:PEP-CTERM motif
MKTKIFALTCAAALLCAVVSAHAGVSGVSSPQVTINGWAFGAGNNVQATGYSGKAGGFTGSLLGTGSHDTNSFLTYCIELEESFRFSDTPMSMYTVQAGSSYFARRRHDAGIADRLGRLMTFAYDQPTRVDSASESTALQLAVWNLVYDTDFSVSGTGAFGDTSAFAAQANSLLAGAQTVLFSRFNVLALEGLNSQDFLLLQSVAVPPSNAVPEPGTLGLVGAALTGLLAAGFKRRRGPLRSMRFETPQA